MSRKYKDITGERFGNLIALELFGKNKRGAATWLCQCDCGNKKVFNGSYLRMGLRTNCGCKKAEMYEKRNAKWDSEVVGKRFGKLQVIEYAETKEGHRLYRCLCDCGNIVFTNSTELKGMHKVSCGCDNTARISKRCNPRERLYIIWKGMNARCKCKGTSGYRNYGGRGISVCSEWRDKGGYANFKNWALANGYDPNAERFACTLDRIDVNEDYSPSNCRWIPFSEQQLNRQNTVYIEIDGERTPLTQVCRNLGINPSTVKRRLKRGIKIEDALTKEILRRRKSQHA